jgi:hypothetical protein
MSAALAATPRANAEKRGWARRAPRDGRVELANDQLAWRLEWRDGKLATSSFVNKLSGRTFPLSEVEELVLTFSGAQHRVEIPWWKFVYGPDSQPVSPGDEQGFKLGYHLPGTPDREWGLTENLLLRGLRDSPRPRGGGYYGDAPSYRVAITLNALSY